MQAGFQQRSATTILLLGLLFERFQGEGFAMSFTMEDFKREFIKEHFAKLTPEEQREVLQSLPPKEQAAALKWLPPERLREVLHLLKEQDRRKVLESLPLEERLAGLSAEQIRDYLDQLTAGRPAKPRKPKKK